MWQTKIGTCIYVSPSGYRVYQNLFFRWLTLGSSALQTVIYRPCYQKPVLQYLSALTLMAKTYPNPACLLGLGGAAVAQMLSAQPLLAVDISAEVIDIAKQFFKADAITNLNIVQNNAIDFLRNNEVRFPHILVDLYNANNYPQECATNEFFALSKMALAEEGFVSINLANISEQWPILRLIKNQFKSYVVIPVKKSANMVIIASKSDDKEWLVSKLKATGTIKKIVWDGVWGYVAEF
ncbi:MAG: spermidine synthase [Legionellales bacterium]